MIVFIELRTFRILILQRTRKSTRISVWKKRKTTLQWELMTIRTTMTTTGSAKLMSQYRQKSTPKNNMSQNLHPQKQQPSLYQPKVSKHDFFFGCKHVRRPICELSGINETALIPSYMYCRGVDVRNKGDETSTCGQSGSGKIDTSQRTTKSTTFTASNSGITSHSVCDSSCCQLASRNNAHCHIGVTQRRSSHSQNGLTKTSKCHSKGGNSIP